MIWYRLWEYMVSSNDSSGFITTHKHCRVNNPTIQLLYKSLQKRLIFGQWQNSNWKFPVSKFFAASFIYLRLTSGFYANYLVFAARVRINTMGRWCFQWCLLFHSQGFTISIPSQEGPHVGNTTTVGSRSMPQLTSKFWLTVSQNFRYGYHLHFNLCG